MPFLCIASLCVFQILFWEPNTYLPGPNSHSCYYLWINVNPVPQFVFHNLQLQSPGSLPMCLIFLSLMRGLISQPWGAQKAKQSLQDLCCTAEGRSRFMGEEPWRSHRCYTCSQGDAREEPCFSMVPVTTTTEPDVPTGTSRNTTDITISPCTLILLYCFFSGISSVNYSLWSCFCKTMLIINSSFFID